MIYDFMICIEQLYEISCFYLQLNLIIFHIIKFGLYINFSQILSSSQEQLEMMQLYSFRTNNQDNFQMHNNNQQKPHKIQTTKMQIQQKMHDMDQQIQKRLLLQLKLSRDEELFNTCKESYLKKLLNQKENIDNNYINNSSNNRLYYDDYQQKSDSLDIRKQFREYLDRSDIIYDYLKKSKSNTPFEKSDLYNQFLQNGTSNTQNNKLSQNDQNSNMRSKKSLSKKSSNKKVKQSPSTKKLLNRCNSQKSIDDKSYKAIRSKGLSRIKSQILQNQSKLIDSTSMMSYGFKTYELNAYDQQKKLKDQIALKICKSTTNLKRKTRKNF